MWCEWVRSTRFHLFLCLCLCLEGRILVAQAPASSILFDRVSTQEGLSNPLIRCMAQDDQGFMWFGTTDGLNRFDGLTFVVYTHNADNPHSLSDNNVWTIYEDRRRDLWIGTDSGLNFYDKQHDRFIRFYLRQDTGSGGSQNAVTKILETSDGRFLVINREHHLFQFDRNSGVFTPYDLLKSNRQPTIINLFKDRLGDLWVNAGTDGLLRVNPSGEIIAQYDSRQYAPDEPEEEGVGSIYEDTAGCLKITTSKGNLLEFDRKKSRFFHPKTYPLAKIFRQSGGGPVFLEDKNGNLWIAAGKPGYFLGGGLYVWNRSSDSLYLLQSDPYNEHTLSDNDVSTVFEDRSGGIWVGTMSGGLNYWNPYRKPFVYQALSYQGRPERSGVSAIWEKENGDLAIAAGTGIYTWNSRKGVTSLWKLPAGGSNPQVTAILKDRNGQIWLGTRQGIFRFANVSDADLADQDYPVPDRYAPAGDAAGYLSNEHVWTILEDFQGKIWAGTVNGLNVYDPDQNTFSTYFQKDSCTTCLSNSWIWTIIEDQDSNLWVGSFDGLNLFNRETESFRRYFHDPAKEKSLAGNMVFSIYPGADGSLWIGSKAGLNRYDPTGNSFDRWEKKDGLGNDNVINILSDQDGFLWLLTLAGLTRFNPQTNEFQYFQPFGLEPMFGAQNFLQTAGGEIVYGVRGGFIRYRPEAVQTNEYRPPVVFTDFRLYGKPGEVSAMAADTTFGITYDREIRLPYQQNDFSISFSALNYLEPEKNQYRYRLLGHHDHWIATSAHDRTATYTHLPAGSYTFQVMASNNDGVWNPEPASMLIFINPPWWATRLAYALYVVAAVLLLVGLYRFQKRRWQWQKQIEWERREAERVKELDAWKTRFYANITHEFRTPLTLILGIADQIAEGSKSGLQESLHMIKRNGAQLLRLINQMLDLSKLESGELPMRMVQGEMVSYLKYLAESFQSQMTARQIRFHFSSSVEALYMEHDPDKLQQIVANLLSNAIKFTAEGGDISLSVQADIQTLILEVRDSGIGIHEDHLPYIFDRFYQVPDEKSGSVPAGTGIGLALTKELVQMMGGSIGVKSEVGLGSTFSVSLPIRRSASLESEDGRFNGANLPAAPAQKKETGPLLLIVEDNADVIRYLSSFLGTNYRLEMAGDGREGVQKAYDLVPDIIVSDVMMPGMNGFELCRTLKNDRRTDHIPIILLTARADHVSMLEGLEHGADAYLVKPFQREELLVHLRKCLELRRHLQERYQKCLFCLPLSEDQYRAEDTFMRRLLEVLEANYAADHFGIEELCQQMAMSRAQFYRKMDALIGVPAARYLRSFRLHKAKMLIESRHMQVSEAAFHTGFKELAHFSKAFKEEFGFNPSELRP